MFLVDKESFESVPLVTCNFKVEVAQGYSDVTLNQVYENKGDAPIETLFMMPTSESFSVNHMTVDFYLSDGKKETLETRVAEREKAKVEYSDAVATG